MVLAVPTYVVEGDRRSGHAFAAVTSPVRLLICGLLTQESLFNAVKEQFLSEFVALESFSVLEYLRLRFLPVVDDAFLCPRPVLRQGSYLINVVEEMMVNVTLSSEHNMQVVVGMQISYEKADQVWYDLRGCF